MINNVRNFYVDQLCIVMHCDDINATGATLITLHINRLRRDWRTLGYSGYVSHQKQSHRNVIRL